MMPLWTTTILPVQSRCGCAFSSVGRPWRGPARVADAVIARDRARPRCTSSRFDSLPALRRRSTCAVAHDRHARRIVAAVLEPPQAVDEHRHDFFRPDVSDDAAHSSVPNP